MALVVTRATLAVRWSPRVHDAEDEPRDVTLTSADASHGGDRVRVFGRGEVVGRYVVIDRVGEGGMGVVYSAYDPELDRKLALKLLHHATGERATARRLRLVREAQAMARLSHRNVIVVHDVGTIDEQVFVAMEFIDGRSLAAWLLETGPTGRPSWDRALAVLVDAGRGLAAAHDAGLVHRDFKPDNVMISHDGRVVVTDFGLARAAGNADDSGPMPAAAGSGRGKLAATVTAAGAIMGTPAYMAPEQHLGQPADARSDQFSFAVATWEAVYGQRPFPGDDIASLAYHVTSGNLREPPSKAGAPTWLGRVLARALALEPHRRYGSMHVLLTELTRDRTWRPRWWAIATGLGAAAATGVYAGFMLDREPAPCAAGRKHVARVWNEDRESRLRDRLLGSGLSYAEEQWPTLRSELQDYVKDWNAAYVDACEATHVRGDQSETLLDARMSCLAGRLGEFSALVDVLERGEPAVVERSLEAVQGLPRLRACSHLETLLDPVPPPADPETAAAVEELRPELARAVALHRAGLDDVGIGTARDLVARAAELHYDPLHAETLATLADYEWARHTGEDAERHLREAVTLALRGRADRIAAHAAVKLVEVLGPDPAREHEAEGWAEMADALLTRTGGDPELEVALAGRRAEVARTRGDLDGARAQLERVLAVQERTWGADDARVADTAVALADVLAAAGDGARANALLERALEIHEYAVGLDHPRTAMVLARLGALARRRGDLEAAIEYLDRALASGELAYGRDGSELIGPLIDEGTVLSEMGRHADAARSLDRAQALADAHPHGVTEPEVGAGIGTDVEHAIALAQADAAMARGDPAQALEYAARVRSGDAGEVAAHTAVIAAEALLEFDRVEEALARARGAQRLVDVPGARPSVLAVRMLVAIGRAELRLEAPTLAAEALGRAVTELDGVGGVATVLRARARFELARALAAEGATSEAIDELVRAAQRDLTGSDPRVLLLRGELATWLAGRAPGTTRPR
jgi:tetratricopeptide (TPR) repeat protein